VNIIRKILILKDRNLQDIPDKGVSGELWLLIVKSPLSQNGGGDYQQNLPKRVNMMQSTGRY
jgi:hypothetical protein